MIKVSDKDTGAPIGEISEAQLKYLQDALEEESRDDRDYYINETTIDGFEQSGADTELVKFLRYALNGRTEMEIRWVRV
jgi:hypothetical protein